MTKQTIRERIEEAQEAYVIAHRAAADASRTRAVVFRAANEAGVSLRDIAGVAGISFQAVHQAVNALPSNVTGRLDEAWPE